MKKIKRIKKAYRKYGKEEGRIMLCLFCSYIEGLNRLLSRKNQNAVSAFRTRFNKYVESEYGRDFLDSYNAFYLNNKDSKRLIKSVFKKQSSFIDPRVLALIEEPKGPLKKKTGEEQKKEITGAAQLIQSNSASSSADKKTASVSDLDVSTMTASQLIFGTLPARNIDYIPYAKAKHSYKFTFRRLENDELFERCYSGKDLNEAMVIANRLHYDYAVIVKVQEET